MGSGCDLVIIATKAFDVEAAARSCLPLLGPETIVQTIQTPRSPEVAAPILAPIVSPSAWSAVSVLDSAPGHAHHNGMEIDPVRRVCGLAGAVAAGVVGKVWDRPGFKVALFDDIKRWSGKN